MHAKKGTTYAQATRRVLRMHQEQVGYHVHMNNKRKSSARMNQKCGVSSKG